MNKSKNPLSIIAKNVIIIRTIIIILALITSGLQKLELFEYDFFGDQWHHYNLAFPIFLIALFLEQTKKRKLTYLAIALLIEEWPVILYSLTIPHWRLHYLSPIETTLTLSICFLIIFVNSKYYKLPNRSSKS